MENRIAFKSGLHELDKAISGFRRGSLTVVAGRPAMGKESFVRTILSNEFVESKGRRRALYGVFSPGFKQDEFLMKLDCAHARVWTYYAFRWKLRPVTLKRLREVRKKYCDDDWSKDAIDFSHWSFRSSWLPHLKRCLRPSRRHKNKTAFIADFRDFWKIEDRKRMLGLWGRLKAVAEESNAPIIVMCGIPRAIERKYPHIPNLKDLQFGRSERYADKILMLYRETYYAPKEGNLYQAKIIIAKNSDGETGEIDVKYDPHCGRFDDA